MFIEGGSDANEPWQEKWQNGVGVRCSDNAGNMFKYPLKCLTRARARGCDEEKRFSCIFAITLSICQFV